MKTIAFIIAVCIIMIFLSSTNESFSAGTFPSHPIQMIIPGVLAEPVEVWGREIAIQMAKTLKGQAVLQFVEGMVPAAGVLAKAKKDGYTLMFAPQNVYFTYAQRPGDVPLNPLNDIEPLCFALSNPYTLAVQTNAPWKSLQDFVADAKQNPGKRRVAVSGLGTVGEFNVGVLRKEAGADIAVYDGKGAYPTAAAVMEGRAEAAALSLSLVYPMVKSGKLRLIQISQKVPEAADIPTMKELGFKNDTSGFRFAVYAPAGLPGEIKQALSSAAEKAATSAEVIKAIQQLGSVPDYKTGDEAKRMLAEEYDMVKEVFSK